MKINLLAVALGAALILSGAPLAQDQSTAGRNADQNSPEMQKAIAFQRAKDRADARQARVEKRHPTIDRSTADREREQSHPGNKVPDPGESQAARVKK